MLWKNKIREIDGYIEIYRLLHRLYLVALGLTGWSNHRLQSADTTLCDWLVKIGTTPVSMDCGFKWPVCSGSAVFQKPLIVSRHVPYCRLCKETVKELQWCLSISYWSVPGRCLESTYVLLLFDHVWPRNYKDIYCIYLNHLLWLH